MSQNGTRPGERFDACRIDHTLLKDDPYVILAASRELVARRAEVGDLILIHCAPGLGPALMERAMTFLKEEGK